MKTSSRADRCERARHHSRVSTRTGQRPDCSMWSGSTLVWMDILAIPCIKWLSERLIWISEISSRNSFLVAWESPFMKMIGKSS
jgi:hypothetical protein